MKSMEHALALARALVAIGESGGIRTEAFVTRMDAPLGMTVGNALEVRECIDIVLGRGPADLQELIVRLATRMVLAGARAGSEADAERKVRAALSSGAGADRLRGMIAAQGGDAAVVDHPERLPAAASVHPVKAHGSGVLAALDAELVGRAGVLLGAGRERKDDPVDPAAGIRLVRRPGDAVRAGDVVLELHAGKRRAVDEAARLAAAAISIADAEPPGGKLVRAWVHASGETRFD
jgi:pyrimidine-nucleoside phosphorylase